MQPQSEAAKDSEPTLAQKVSAVFAAICLALTVLLASWVGIAHLAAPPGVMAVLFFIASPILAIFVYIRCVRFLRANFARRNALSGPAPEAKSPAIAGAAVDENIVKSPNVPEVREVAATVTQPESEAARNSGLTLAQKVSAVFAAICLALTVLLASWVGVAHLTAPSGLMAVLFFIASPILAIFVYIRSVRFFRANFARRNALSGRAPEAKSPAIAGAAANENIVKSPNVPEVREVAATATQPESEVAKDSGQTLAQRVSPVLAGFGIALTRNIVKAILRALLGDLVIRDYTPGQETRQAILQDLATTGTTSRYSLQNFHPRKGESVIWSFKEVGYHRKTSYSEYQAGRQGISFRIAKGVSYRIGGARGKSVRRSAIEFQSRGTLVLTTAGFTFLSTADSVRIPIGKVLALQLHGDGISLNLDYVRNPYCGFVGLRKADLEFIKRAVDALRSSSSSQPALSEESDMEDS